MRTFFHVLVISAVPTLLVIGLLVFLGSIPRTGVLVDHILPANLTSAAQALASLPDNSPTALFTHVAEASPRTKDAPAIYKKNTVRTIASSTLLRGRSAQKVTTPLKKALLEKKQATHQSLVTEERQSILEAQNRVRAEKGIVPLVWSSALAESAQAWADTSAARGCALAHSGGSHGEVVYYSRKYGSTLSALTPRTPQEIIDAFTAESSFYTYKNNSCLPGKICGHYTQIMWADSTSVGCAKSICQAQGERKEIWVCHYDPRGNIEGVKPY